MDQVIKVFYSLVDFLYDAFDRLTGNTSEWIIKDGAATYVGFAKYIVVLKDTTFTSFVVNDSEELARKGLTGITVPALTILTGTKGKKITTFTQAAGGLTQVFE